MDTYAQRRAQRDTMRPDRLDDLRKPEENVLVEVCGYLFAAAFVAFVAVVLVMIAKIGAA